LAARVDAIPGGSPVLLRSYDSESGIAPLDEPALRTVAFVYDNALATIALVACGRLPEAERIGQALRLATGEARVRNAYREGAVENRPLPNGWWDSGKRLWAEDPYQMGTATGNVAWVGLALLTLHDATRATPWLPAAAKCGDWVVEHASDHRGGGGFTGGLIGFDPAPTPLLWKSTEHNIDLVALFARLARSEPAAHWDQDEAGARRFLGTQWDPLSGRFFVGTGPDGATVNRSTFALDTQLWPSLLPGAPPEWSKALTFAERDFAVAGGFDFNDDRDGLWVEGTAQAALAEHYAGREPLTERLLAEVSKQVSPGGLVYATREARISTGLSNNPDASSADFFYYRRPHLGATAWVALAALGWNPFVGGR
jgi:hypothetical protein